MTRPLPAVFLCLLCLLALPRDGRPDPASSTEAGQISGSRMQQDVAFLSSPSLNGRQTGSADDLHGARFVAERFRALGLWGGEEATQSAAVLVHRIEDDATLVFSSGTGGLAAQVGPEFLPILDSPTVHLTADVVFVGYGISDPVRGFDEYAGVAARDRVVLFFRGKPDGYADPVTLADKVRTAREKGAVAFLIMTGPVPNAYEARRGLAPGPLASYSRSKNGLPGAWISSELAGRAFQAAGFPNGASLKDVHDTLNRLHPRSSPTPLVVTLSWTATPTVGRLHNVLGTLPGGDPSLTEETVLLGAHRDHFGRQAGLLFPGADDNASGTAILLEAARVLALHPPRRTVLFASFSGEEQDLLGSRLYVSRPARDLTRTAAMINVDHAGVGNGRLMVGLHGLPRERGVAAAKRAGVTEKVDFFGYFPGGDHVPFKEAGVATAAVVSGGAHLHFHQPGDKAETVQPEILEAAAGYVLALVRELADR